MSENLVSVICVFSTISSLIWFFWFYFENVQRSHWWWILKALRVKIGSRNWGFSEIHNELMISTCPNSSKIANLSNKCSPRLHTSLMLLCKFEALELLQWGSILIIIHCLLSYENTFLCFFCFTIQWRNAVKSLVCNKEIQITHTHV